MKELFSTRTKKILVVGAVLALISLAILLFEEFQSFRGRTYVSVVKGMQEMYQSIFPQQNLLVECSAITASDVGADPGRDAVVLTNLAFPNPAGFEEQRNWLEVENGQVSYDVAGLLKGETHAWCTFAPFRVHVEVSGSRENLKVNLVEIYKTLQTYWKQRFRPGDQSGKTAIGSGMLLTIDTDPFHLSQTQLMLESGPDEILWSGSIQFERGKKNPPLKVTPISGSSIDDSGNLPPELKSGGVFQGSPEEYFCLRLMSILQLSIQRMETKVKEGLFPESVKKALLKALQIESE